jgi:hypothetical protein
MTRTTAILIAIAGTLALAGCEGGGSGGVGGDPGARALPAGQSCQSVRAELNKMDAQGAQSKFDKKDAASKAVADRYNGLLNQYLGARCHA